MPLTDAEEAVAAQVRLKAATASDPTLTDDEVATIVLGSKRADSAGREITDEAWVPTFDVRSAIAEAWEAKAGRAAGRADITRGGESIKRSALAENCLRMAALFRRGGSSFAMTAPFGRQRDPDLIPIANGPDECLEDGVIGGAAGSVYPIGGELGWQ